MWDTPEEASGEGGMQMTVALFDQELTFFTYTEPKAS